jgi:hypothetical protein
MMTNSIMEDNPFVIVESEIYQKAVKYSPISRPTLMKYIESTHEYLIERIGSYIPNRFGVIFDGNPLQSSVSFIFFLGWTCNGTNEHYFGYFLTWSTNKDYELCLLSCDVLR